LAEEGRSWIFKHGHDLLAFRLVRSIHYFAFVACSVVLMARLLDFHASYFSILESTFQLGLEEGIQIMVNPSSKRLVSTNPFTFCK
jgi:hypothetical protein